MQKLNKLTEIDRNVYYFIYFYFTISYRKKEEEVKHDLNRIRHQYETTKTTTEEAAAATVIVHSIHHHIQNKKWLDII